MPAPKLSHWFDPFQLMVVPINTVGGIRLVRFCSQNPF